ncbi:MAG: hypothetical protein BWY71_01920 [Planctomycetes bacterium ADurb.Bin412]|nr:MAG: hypothetical protein BWY71_01920 [Planctomycetes bacterium ADurb.Bin412]
MGTIAITDGKINGIASLEKHQPGIALGILIAIGLGVDIAGEKFISLRR